MEMGGFDLQFVKLIKKRSMQIDLLLGSNPFIGKPIVAFINRKPTIRRKTGDNRFTGKIALPLLQNSERPKRETPMTTTIGTKLRFRNLDLSIKLPILFCDVER